METGSPYPEVRALSRGIALLVALNRLGEARSATLAQMAGIDRTTTYRMLATLEGLGLVVRRVSDDKYVLGAQVRALSDGYHARDHLTRSAALHLGALFQEVLWPTDFAVFEGGQMVIRETTHRFSPYSVHRAMIGRTRPLFSSALGRAYLAGADAAQRETIIDIARGLEGGVPSLTAMARIAADFAARGYAWSVGETEAHISALALPVRGQEGAVGAINLVFFRSAMSVEDAARRYLGALRDCVRRIEEDMMRGDADRQS